MLALQAVVSLNKGPFESGLGSIGAAVRNVTGAMGMAFGGVTSEIVMMTRAFGPLGGAISVLKESITVGADFEQQMANVSSVTGLFGDELDRVADAARDMAKTTKFTATEAATALYALGSAGINSADALINVLEPSLLLAGATLSDTKVATETLTAALLNFNIPAKDATHVADQFAGAIAASPADMERLAEAMKYAGPAAAGLGISLEKTVAEIAAFHLVGLRGEMAGTSFRMVLLELREEAAKAGSVIGEALGSWDSGTEGITGAVRRLAEQGISTNAILDTLGKRAGPALAVLMKIGADAMDQLAARIEKGADVSKMYDIQMQTLTGRFYIFKSAVQDVFQELFTNFEPTLSSVTERATKMADAFGDLIKALFAGDWAAVAEMFSELGESIAAAFKSALESARENIGKMANVFEDINWGESFSTLGTSAIAAFDAILSEAQSAFGKISTFIKSQDWGAVWNSAKQGAILAFDFWYSTATDVWGKIASFLEGVNGEELWGSVRAGAAALWSEIESIAKSIWPTIQNYAENAWAVIAESGRIAWESIASMSSKTDWAAAFSSIKTELAYALQTAYLIAAGWVTDMATLIRKIDWGELARMAGEAVIRARDFIVEGFESLVSGGKIADVFKRVGQVIGALLKAAFEGIGGFFASAWDDLASGNWEDKAASFYKSIFIGGLQAITGLFTGVLEGLFGRHVIDNVVVGAQLMMLDIKKAIQSKIGEILLAFNELMVGIITKTSDGAARVAEVFGFEGMADEIRARADEFSEAFSSGTNGMTEAAERTGEEIKALEQYILDLNKPVVEVDENIKKTSDFLDVFTDSQNKANIETGRASGIFDALGPITRGVLENVSDMSEANKESAGSFMAYENPVKSFQDNMRDNIIEMGRATAAASGLEEKVESVGDATGEAAKSTEKSTEEMEKLHSAFGEMNDFDVANFTSRMRLLATGLRGLDMPDITLPDFSKFKIPNITNQSVTRFRSALLILSGIKIPKDGLSSLASIGAVLSKMKIPDIKSIPDFLSAMLSLRDGLVKLDFGSLGNMSVDIKGSIVSQKLDDIYKLIKGADGIIWA